MNQSRYVLRDGLSARQLLTVLAVSSSVFCFPASGVAAQGSAFSIPETAEENTAVIVVERPPEYRYLDVIEALDANGYQILSTSRTLLNRFRIRARNDVHLREIVISRASGAILRDAILDSYSNR